MELVREQRSCKECSCGTEAVRVENERNSSSYRSG